MKRVALITCAVLPEPDVDEEMTLAALRSRGLEVQMVAWDEPHSDLADFDIAVIRSTWNYYEKPQEFLFWVEEAASQTVLLNPAEVVRGNHHKGYLKDCESAGIPIVPTEMVTLNTPKTVFEIAEENNWGSVVIKPAVSAGSHRTRFFGPGQFREAQEWLQMILRDGDALVQEYLSSVNDGGEVAYIWIGGSVTHGVIKQPRFAEDSETVSKALIPTIADNERIKPYTSLVPPECLYARIDLMRGANGDWLLSELELIEPSLFFVQHPPALGRFVDELEAKLGVMA